MSDYKLAPEYDTNTNIKDIEVSTRYIAGLDVILLHYFTDVTPDPSTLKQTFEKFEKIVVNQDKSVVLEDYEQQIYTLFSLQQLFKAKAKEQGLITNEGRMVSEDDLTAELEQSNLNSEQIKSLLNLAKEKK